LNLNYAITRLLRGETDLFASVTLNKLFGKKVLFVEKPHETKDWVKVYAKNHNVKRMYLISPLNYREFGSEKKTFTDAIGELCFFAKEQYIEVIPHLHLPKKFIQIKNLKVDKRTFIAIKKTKEFFSSYLGKPITKFSFGFWRVTHRNKHLQKAVTVLGMNLTKREFHVYDWWYYFTAKTA